MLTLGIHDGHTATACLFEDGRVIACISEERLNRIKEWDGFPEESIRKCLEIAGKDIENIDAVGICSIMPQIGYSHYLTPPGYKKLFSSLTRMLPRSLLQRSGNIRLIHSLAGILFKNRRDGITGRLRDMGLRTKKIHFFEHHLLHAASAYYTNWYRNERTLIVTLDGSGDAVCATLNIGEGGRIRRIAEVFNYNSICEFYTRVTQHLGMKPMSHEYKVMGMAPYASKAASAEILSIFRKYFSVSEENPLLFLNNSGLWKWQFNEEFRMTLAEKRFDLIAGAAQDLFEEVIVLWIKNALKSTGAGDLALSGGGFMNVKLNYLVSELPGVSSLFIFPSCGDESNPVGAAIMAALESGFPHERVDPLGMIYWGPSYGVSEIEKAIDLLLKDAGVRIARHENINKKVAEKLSEGKIVGRLTGRMEWGARALGNRSILADPRDPGIINRINIAIKMRDFWMPFAPAILKEHRDEYLNLRGDFRSPFMTIAAPAKENAWDEIPAGLHPFDRSARAQVLDPENHPSFYEVVSKFRDITGVGGVLNTSFNLHGDPIVCSPEDAIDTFLRSGLDILQLEDFLIEK
jgi:carbamoyltransferase